MKVLFDHPSPFVFTHGGFQTQIEQTKRGLESCGVEVDWLRWWDDTQRGDIVHYFGRPSPWYVLAAQRVGMKVVVAELLTGLGSRGPFARKMQKALIALLRRSYFFDRMGWNAFQLADASIALTPWEATLMRDIFNAPDDRLHVLPNGVEEEFFRPDPVQRGEFLICTATITERKRVLEAARAAVAARTPLWIIGKPYSESDPYARAFMTFARQHTDLIRYEGPILDRASLAHAYRQARGFILLSAMESLSLSALEAAATGCPLLLADLPWANTTFGNSARYCRPGEETESLRRFYQEAPQLPPVMKPKSWAEVGEQLRSVYERLLQRP